LVHKIKKYLKIINILVKYQIKVQLTYRFNFWCNILTESGWVVAKLMYTLIVFRFYKNMTQDYYLYIGTYILLTGLIMGVYGRNISLLSRFINTGELDFYLLKPVSLQFITTLQKIDIGSILPNSIVGITMIIIGWKRSGIMVNSFTVISFILSLIVGMIICYSLFFIPQLLAFIIIKSNNFINIIWELWDINNVPANMFPQIVRTIGMYLFPILLPVSYPILIVKGALNLRQILYVPFLTIISALIFSYLFQKGLKYYESASS